ncbi:hypothetical protein HK103_007199 [Boothiomyces macroporosus]|uniref:Uncharacterized protein n=1 Tax=Boothiomyces macroporosus TaxID=261099 RepID=A0AAD5Y6H7_9FUNG|nr:hypothetical protein HK103_007199 [Boothiomyces macroporosus]
MDCNGPMSENVIIGENYTSLYYGLISTKIVEFDSKPSVWIAAVKWGLDWTNYFDRWFLTIGILSMTFNVTYIAIELYYRRDKPVTALIQISWLAYNIVWLLSGIYAPSSEATEWIVETANILYGLSTLASVLYTAYIISTLFKLKTSQYAMYTVIVLLNFLLNFPFYFSNLVQYGNLQYLYEWNRFADIWIYFMFIFNLAPNAYFLQKYYELETMVQHKSELAFLFQLFRKNKIFTLLCLSHLLNFIGYVGLDVILTWTVLLGSDKAQNTAYMAETFMITVHFILAFYSLMYTKGIISGVQKHHPKSAISSIFPKAKSLPMN